MKIILKSRQHGVSTFCDIDFLDDALFVKGIDCGIIADDLEDGKKLLATKIKYPHERLPEIIRLGNPYVGNVTTVEFTTNGSTIWVDTSMRSTTVQRLHISEFGRICAKFPDKAREIVTGSFNAIKAGQKVYVESTAEGREGYFFDYCQRAQKMKLEGRKLTSLDFKFFFFAWWEDVGNVLTQEEAESVVIESSLVSYFNNLRDNYRIVLSLKQKAWYCKILERQQDDMKREHPSIPEEAFEMAIEGAYYKKQFTKIYKDSRITNVPYDTGLQVYTFWDLGMDDSTCIWFVQFYGEQIRIVDYYENNGEGLSHYINYLHDKRRENGFVFGAHVAPFDINVRELSTGKTRLEAAREMGVNFQIAPRISVMDGIESVRRLLNRCIFDEVRCSDGIKHLEAYRKDFDAKHNKFKDVPRHDESSHAADAFRTLAVSDVMSNKKQLKKVGVKIVSSAGWT